MKRFFFAVWRFLAGLAAPSGRANRRRLQRRGLSPGSLRIRDAAAADIPELAVLHVKTWNATYAPMLMKGPSPLIRERQWRQAFDRADPRWFCLVVEGPAGELIGFAQGNASDNPAFAGELGKIYLLREYQRVGLGSRLLGHVARRFLSLGITSMWLYGDPRNPSGAAWRALGATKTDHDPGTGNYGWRDLTPLAGLPE